MEQAISKAAAKREADRQKQLDDWERRGETFRASRPDLFSACKRPKHYFAVAALLDAGFKIFPPD